MEKKWIIFYFKSSPLPLFRSLEANFDELMASMKSWKSPLLFVVSSISFFRSQFWWTNGFYEILEVTATVRCISRNTVGKKTDDSIDNKEDYDLLISNK